MMDHYILEYLAGSDPTFDRNEFVLGAQVGLMSMIVLAIFAQLLLRLF